MASDLIEQQLSRMPTGPGVYLMKDAGGNILYVGKAANLHNRVRSYFSGGHDLSPKTERLATHIADIDFMVTASEQEALILELNLIKRYHPRYNVRLKDDKSFPYLKIETNQEWPRVYATRRLEQDGGRYFGPFASVKSLKQTMRVLKNIFPFRFCTKPITGVDSRACLEYHMGKCVAPCIGAVTREEYAAIINEVVLFLEGKQERIVKELEERMNRAAEALDFEKAALLRDEVQALQSVIQAQRIATTVRGEQDVIAFAQDGDTAFVQVFFIRGDKLTGRESFVLQGTQHEEPGQIMSSFIKQFYGVSPYIPPVLLLQHHPEDEAVIADWLRSKRGAGVTLLVPQRGVKKEMLQTVIENARQGLEHLRIKQLAAPDLLDSALAELQNVLRLNAPPLRMEGYDISNIQGRMAVGSMVVFEGGRPKPAHYRRFRIKTVAGADDYAMLHEVLTRRFKRVHSGTSDSWAVLPDLVLIDGGRGQLNAALAAMKEVGADAVPIMSLAKQNEEIFVPWSTEPITLPGSNPGLQLLQRLRDEAHRFAISYFAKVHKRQSFASALDGIPGIGQHRRRELLKKFGTVRAIREASVEEIAATKGMSESLARKTKESL